MISWHAENFRPMYCCCSRSNHTPNLLPRDDSFRIYCVRQMTPQVLYKSTAATSGDCEGHKNIHCPLVTGDCQPVANDDQGRYMSFDSWTFVADTSRLKRHTTDELSRCILQVITPIIGYLMSLWARKNSEFHQPIVRRPWTNAAYRTNASQLHNTAIRLGF